MQTEFINRYNLSFFFFSTSSSAVMELFLYAWRQMERRSNQSESRAHLRFAFVRVDNRDSPSKNPSSFLQSVTSNTHPPTLPLLYTFKHHGSDFHPLPPTFTDDMISWLKPDQLNYYPTARFAKKQSCVGRDVKVKKSSVAQQLNTFLLLKFWKTYTVLSSTLAVTWFVTDLVVETEG